MHNLAKYLINTLIGLMLSVVIIIGICYYVISSNPDLVPDLITQLVEEKTDVKIGFRRYQFSPAGHFPLMSLQFDDLHLRDQLQGQELVKVGSLNLKFYPWNLIRRKIDVYSMVLDNLHVHIYKDSAGVSNLDLLKPDKYSGKRNRSINQGPKFGPIQLKRFHFNFTDEKGKKAYGVSFTEANLEIKNQAKGREISLSGDCFFEGLLFKPENGPFLHHKNAKLSLQVAIDAMASHFRILPSTLVVNGNEFQLQGELTSADTTHLQLQIHSDGILKSEALPLLSNKIQESLKDLEVQKPIQARVNFDGPVGLGKPMTINLDFSAEATQVAYKKWSGEDVAFSGSFSNNCDPGQEKISCLEIEWIRGRLMGDLPSRISAQVPNIKNIGDVRVQAEMVVPMTTWQSYLPAGQPFDIRGGRSVLSVNYRGDLRDFDRKAFRKLERSLAATISMSDVAFIYKDDQLSIRDLSGRLRLRNSILTLDGLTMNVDGVRTALEGKVLNALPNILGGTERMNTDLKASFDYVSLDRFFNSPADKQRLSSAPPEDPAQTTNLAHFVNNIHESMDTRLEINVDSIRYRDLTANDLGLRLSIIDSCTSVGSALTETCLYISDLKARLQNKIPIEAGMILKRLDDPFAQLNLFLTSPVAELQSFLPQDSLRFSGGQLRMNLNTWGPVMDFAQEDSLLNKIKMNGVAVLENVEGTYLGENVKIDQLNSSLYFDEKGLLVDSLYFHYNNIPLQLRGDIHSYLPFMLGRDQPANVDVDMYLPYFNLEEVTGEAEGPELPVADTTTGSFSPAQWIEPLKRALKYVNGDFRISIDDLQDKHYPIKDISFHATLSEANDSIADCLKLKDFSGTLWDEIPIRGNIDITDFDDPQINADIQFRTPFTSLKKILPSDHMVYQDGDVFVDMDYSGKLHPVFNAENYFLKARIDGRAMISNGNIAYRPRGFFFEQINGTLSFTEKLMKIDSLSLLLNDNEVYATGQSADLLPFFFLPERKVRIDLDVRSPYFEFSKFKTPYELGEISTPMRREATQYTIQKIDQLLDIGSIELTCNVDKALFRRFEPTDIKGDLHLDPDNVILRNLRMDIADGSFEIEGTIREIARHAPKMAVKVKAQDNSIQEVFENFDNFGQSDMTHENIRGTVSADINLSADLDTRYKVIPSTILGDMKLEIANGALVDMPAFKELTGFIFKKRQLDNIKFDTLTNTTQFRGYDLHVDYFYIHSTSLDFGVKGLYSLGPEDKTNLLFEFPLGNLFKRHIDKKLLGTRDSRRKGLPILIEATEENDKLKFKLRLFKKIDRPEDSN